MLDKTGSELVKVERTRVRDELVEVMKGWLLVKDLKETVSRNVLRHLERFASITILLAAISVSNLFLDITQRYLLSVDKDSRKLAPLCLGQLLIVLLVRSIKHLIGEVKHQVNNARCDFNVNSPARHLLVPINLAVIFLLALNLLLAFEFTRFCHQLGFMLHDFVFLVTDALNFHRTPLPLLTLHGFAFTEALITIGIVLLVQLLLHQLLDEHVLLLLLIKTLLSCRLIHSQLAASTFPLFSSEVALLLCLFDFVHGGGEAEVLDLARRNSLFLLHSAHGIFHIHVLLNTQLLQILIEFTDAVTHLSSGFIELLRQLRLEQVDLTVFEILLPGNVVSPFLAVLCPVHGALLLPLFHEFLVLTELAAVGGALLLLNRGNQASFLLILI